MSIILTSAVKFWNISCMLRSVFHHLQWRLLDASGILRIERYQYYWKIYATKLTGIIWKKLWQHAQSWLNNNITRLVHGNHVICASHGSNSQPERYDCRLQYEFHIVKLRSPIKACLKIQHDIVKKMLIKKYIFWFSIRITQVKRS